MMDLDTIRAIADPTEQAREAIATIARLQALTVEASEIRTAAVRRLYHEHGMRMQDIADQLGLSVQRVQQLVTGVGARARKKVK